jgi:hypothetical protein
VIDHLPAARILISPSVVGAGVAAGKRENVVGSEDITSGVPYAAWLAADHAFDDDSRACEGDELHRALAAASPHIRIDELDGLLQELTLRLVRVPLLGKKANGARVALDEVIQLLIERKSALEVRSP